jgi:hypothetical protein
MFRLCNRQQVPNAHDLKKKKKEVKCVEDMLKFGWSFKLNGYRNVGVLGILFC